jgi:hypothetical protein
MHRLLGTGMAWSLTLSAALLLSHNSASAQGTWTQQTPPTSPTPDRFLSAMAYDAARDEVVLFGGAPDPNNVFANDTWVWNGTTWTQRLPSTMPSPRSNHSMAYDAARGEIVLFGGYDTGTLGDTWVWNGTDWTQKAPATVPPARYYAAMAYDAVNGVVVMFGGHDANSINYDDTWVWDGTDWTQRFPLTSPPALQAHAMAFDTLRGEVVLFGGDTGDGNNSPNGSGNQSDTWTWNGATWTLEAPASVPPARYFHALGGGPSVVLFGGQSNLGPGETVFGDTWTWDGGTWTPAPSATNPAARIFHAMAYDSARSEVVLSGGVSSNGGTIFGDTWTFEASAPPVSYVASIQPPINADATSVFNKNRGVVPVKFTVELNGAPTCQLPAATIALSRTAGAVIGPINENEFVHPSDDGVNFRVSDCQYVYNLAVGTLGVGTYEVQISIGTSTVGTATFSLR